MSRRDEPTQIKKEDPKKLLRQVAKNGKPESLNPADIFELFARLYGWTPEVVGKLTYLQILAYLDARTRADRATGAAQKSKPKPQTMPAGSWQEANAKLAEINANKKGT